MPSSVQSLSNACSPVGTRAREASKRSVNSLPLSVRICLILIGQASCSAFRNLRALAADLLGMIWMKPQRDLGYELIRRQSA